MSSNIVNFYSTVNTPSTYNTNNYVPLTSIDYNDDWVFNSSGNQLECIVPGNWHFTIKYQMVGLNDVTNASDSLLSGWVEKNNIVVDGSESTGFVSMQNAKNILCICYSGSFSQGDILRFGIRSTTTNNTLNVQCQPYTDKSGVFSPSVSFTGMKVKAYTNLTSLISSTTGGPSFPTQVNTDEYVSLADVVSNNLVYANTTDLSVDPLDNTILNVNTSGTWQFAVQYQMSNINDVNNASNALLLGWLEKKTGNSNAEILQGIANTFQKVPNSGTSGSCADQGSKNILTLIFNLKVVAGEKYKFGVKSLSAEATPVLNVNCARYAPFSGNSYYSHAVKITCVKVNDCINFRSSTSLPSQTDNNQFAVLNSTSFDNNNFMLDSYNNTQLICKNPGSWVFTIQYQMVNDGANPTLTADNSQVCAWIVKNNSPVLNSNVTGSAPLVNAKDILVISHAFDFSVNDLIRFGARRSSNNVLFNPISFTACKVRDINTSFFVDHPFTITQDTYIYANNQCSVTNMYDYILNIDIGLDATNYSTMNNLFDNRTFIQNTLNNQQYNVDLSINHDKMLSLLVNKDAVGIYSTQSSVALKPAYTTLNLNTKDKAGTRLLEIVATKIFGHAKARAAIANDDEFYTNTATKILDQIVVGITDTVNTHKNEIFEQYVQSGRISEQIRSLNLLTGLPENDDGGDLNPELMNMVNANWEFPVYFTGKLVDQGTDNADLSQLNTGPDVGGNRLQNGKYNIPILLRFHKGVAPA
jgi:hypothetical protein